MPMGNLLIIINCSNRKRYEDEVKKILGALPGFDLENENKYRALIKDFIKPAIDIYDGPEFRILRKYRDHIIRGLIDVFIVSARYGLINGLDEIIPYDAYLGNAGDHNTVINKWSMYGNWGVERLINGHWDYGIIRLTNVYIKYITYLIPNPCTLAEKTYLLLSRVSFKSIRCTNGVFIPVRGVGSSQHYLEKLLKEYIGTGGISAPQKEIP